MDRMTFYDNMEKFWRVADDAEVRDGLPTKGEYVEQSVIDRLAAYEDTGLEPEEVQELLTTHRTERCESADYDCVEPWKYRRAEAEGRLIVLPCKVGDTVYEPTNRGTISTYLVRGFRIEPFDSIWLEWDIQTGFVYRNIDGVNADAIGKTVFLSYEEAEAALGGGGDG